VLAVACANLTNMMLARGAMRHHEIGVRLALGAGRARVIRQLLTESAMLGILGGIAGLALSICLSRLLVVLVEQAIPPQFGGGLRLPVDFSPDLRVAAYTLGLSLVSGLLFGLSPALQLARVNPSSALKDEGPSYGGRLTRSRLRSVLVAGQVAVSMMLLITAGLLTRGLTRSRTAEAGFETRSVYFLNGDFGDTPALRRARQHRLVQRLQTLPVVERIGEGTVPLLGTWTPPIIVDGVYGRTLASYAGDTCLETLGIPLVAGRTFTPQEVERSAPVAVISESAARGFWPARNPIGRRFQLDIDWRGTLAAFEVVGVAKDVRFANLTRIDPARVYLPPKPGDLQPALLRIHGSPRVALPAIRSAIQAADPDLLPGLVMMSLEEGPVWFQKIQSQAAAWATLSLAALALLLAGAGIYGVMAYLVSQRTREIGIRMALGAGARQVVREVVGGGLRPVVAGIVIGIAAAAGLSAVLHSTLRFPGSADFLYGVSFYDPGTFLGLSAFLLLIAALASAAPARRAAKVDPAVALRWE
jgi:putative ABC transport system permease protein